MGTEIERKFLVDVLGASMAINNAVPIVRHYTQGFLSLSDPCTRVRIVKGELEHKLNNELAILTIKGKGTLVRKEYEFEIQVPEAMDMLHHLKQGQIITKNRYVIFNQGHRWEIDEFLGNLAGLWLAEVELTSEFEEFQIPPWVRQEVTEDPRYTNASLAKHGAP